jgi:hypothetical protein
MGIPGQGHGGLHREEAHRHAAAVLGAHRRIDRAGKQARSRTPRTPPNHGARGVRAFRPGPGAGMRMVVARRRRLVLGWGRAPAPGARGRMHIEESLDAARRVIAVCAPPYRAGNYCDDEKSESEPEECYLLFTPLLSRSFTRSS